MAKRTAKRRKIKDRITPALHSMEDWEQQLNRSNQDLEAGRATLYDKESFRRKFGKEKIN